MDTNRRFALSALARLLLGLLPGVFLVDLAVGWSDRATGTDEDLWQEDEQLGWVTAPGYTEDEWGTSLDRFGLRNPELPAAEPDDELRILGLGASRIWGARNVRQEHVWNYWLEELVRDHAPVPVRVLNAGVQAYSVSQTARRGVRLLDEERDGVRIDPDLVLIALSPGAQMLIDNSAARQWTRVDGQLVEASVIEGWPEALVGPRVALHRLLMRSNLYVRHRAKLRGTGDDRPESIQRWTLTRAVPPPGVAEPVEEAFADVAALRDACAERGIALVALLVPTEAQDSEARWRHYTSTSAEYGAPPVDTPRLEGIEVLRERCDALGIESWDLSVATDQFALDRPKYYADDGIHWSGHGHYLVARALMRELREGDWLAKLLPAQGD